MYSVMVQLITHAGRGHGAKAPQVSLPARFVCITVRIKLEVDASHDIFPPATIHLHKADRLDFG